jgi:L-seryl-tRNA(Ser) seleniumtransferase
MPSPTIYDRLGVRRVINAAGTFTALGGSLMPPEVIAAWVEAAHGFVDLVELHERVGQRIAQLLGVEAALVTTGAAGALLLGTAAVVTRGDPAAIARLPETTGLPNEVLLQPSHRSGYDRQLATVGVKLIPVATPAEVHAAISDRTAALFYMNYLQAEGPIPRRQWVELARHYRLPTIVDAAADVPPLSQLSELVHEGFDLIALSGGKAIRGPNDTGLLLGRADLIAAAQRNAAPHEGTIGRALKVSKEDLAALAVAVERFVTQDPAALGQECDRRIAVIQQAVQNIPSVSCQRIVPPIANAVPHVQITWDEQRLGLTATRLTADLATGDPPIRLDRVHGTGDRGILIAVATLQEGDEHIVAERLATLLRTATQ